MTVALCLGISPHFWSSQLPFSKPMRTDIPLSLRADQSDAVTYRVFELLHLYYTIYLKKVVQYVTDMHSSHK